jgi:predicted DNA-binding transcriptional regulator
MNQDQLIGYLILLGSVLGIIVYIWLLFLSPPGWAWITIQLSALVAVGAVLLITAWIGYTLATTPPPTPIEDMDFDFDEDLDFEENEDKSVEEEEEA